MADAGTGKRLQSRLRLRWRRPTVPLWEELPAPSPKEREELEELYALPPQDRAVIHLHYYEGYSTQEIAQLLHCRPARFAPGSPGPESGFADC